MDKYRLLGGRMTASGEDAFLTTVERGVRSAPWGGADSDFFA